MTHKCDAYTPFADYFISVD